MKKSSETRKALRFFAERRVKTHFVDLMERAASLGELQALRAEVRARPLHRSRLEALCELGLRHCALLGRAWLEKLVDEPLLLKMPLVRNGNALTIGLAEQDWKAWTTQ